MSQVNESSLRIGDVEFKEGDLYHFKKLTMSFSQLINHQLRRSFSDRGRPLTPSPQVHFIEDVASRYESTEIKKPVDQKLPVLDLEMPNLGDDCGWQCEDQLGDPVQRQDPFNHIGQYNDISNAGRQSLNDLKAFYIDPLTGYRPGLQEESDARMAKFQDMIRDQMINYDRITKDLGWGYTVTITYDNSGRAVSKLWTSPTGYTAFTKRDESGTTTTYKNSNGEEISHDDWKSNQGSFLVRFWEWLSGGQGNSNITAETDWGGYYWFQAGLSDADTLTQNLHSLDTELPGEQQLMQALFGQEIM